MSSWGPNPDIGKHLASSHKDLETFFGRRALGCLSRPFIHICVNQRPLSFCDFVSFGANYPLVLSLSTVFVSILTHLDINSAQKTSV